MKVVIHTMCITPGFTMQVEHLALTPDVGRRVRALAAALEEAEGHHAVEASAQAGCLSSHVTSVQPPYPWL